MLVVGGGGEVRLAEGPAYSATAEVYDPATGRWTATGSMVNARAGHTAVLLGDGRVLVAGGGLGDDVTTRSAELYDPATGRWTVTGIMADARRGHTATVLADGSVLVVGGVGLGSDPPKLATVELYDAIAGRWAAGPSLATARTLHTATRLMDGRVLVLGDFDFESQGRNRYLRPLAPRRDEADESTSDAVPPRVVANRPVSNRRHAQRCNTVPDVASPRHPTHRPYGRHRATEGAGDMGRFLIIPLVGALVLATAAPVAAAPNTSNLSGSGRTIQGEWYGDSGYGSVYLFDESNGTYGEIFEESGLYAECAAGPDGEVYGFQGTRIQGWANGLTINVDAKLNAGSAAGDFEIAIETVDECAGTYDVEFDTVSVMVDVTGTGSVAMFRNSGSFKIPGEYNAHSRYRGKERPADGAIDLGSLGTRDFDWATMASYSWSEHTNG